MCVEHNKRVCSCTVPPSYSPLSSPLLPGFSLQVYRVHTEHPIRVALFFPTHLEMESRADGTRLDTLDVLCKWLISAKRTLDVCVFTITNSAIARALLGAHRKGVRVRIITDDEQVLSTGSKVRELGVAGIDIRTDNSRFHMHHKFALLDDAVLINGSFNWTRQAESSNNENVCVSNDGYFVEQFSDEFQRKWDQFEGQRRTK
jgi:phosphatidylserine/phosphatidylglycerophosphate/cardiolipin synthase-like enzyme